MGGMTMGEILVAAFDAPDKDKQLAWIVCDGFDDQIEIQQALDEWPKVRISLGTFTLSETLEMRDGPWPA